MAATLRKLERQIIPDECPDASYLEQEGLGFEERLAAYQRDEFYFVWIQAVAEIHLPFGSQGVQIIQTIESPGLWGIEDDSGETYFESVYAEELRTLEAMLAELGVRDPDELLADELKRADWYAADCPPVQA